MGAAEYWDEEAERFDEQPDHGLRDPPVRQAWAGLLLPLMPCASAWVADLGCGTGSVSLLLAEAGHRVSGLDISPVMVGKARLKLASYGREAHVTVGDAATPPWPPASFDVVMTRHVLWAMDDPDGALRRWVTLLAPGGVLLLVEGLWWTGGGMGSSEVTDLVLRHRAEAEVVVLDDPGFWGGPVRDERIAVVSRR
jgi:SAM-dependent methyltransferase